MIHKFFKVKKYFILALAGLLDIFEEIKDPFGICATTQKAYFGWVPRHLRRHNFFRAVRTNKRRFYWYRLRKIKRGHRYFRHHWS